MRAFGKYRLVEPIASGGMAEVWRAEAPGAAGFVKEVALKLIRGDHDASGEFVEMFIREARLASRLAHGNIVQVFDFDQVDGRYYIAMELVHGRTLRAAVDRCRAMGVRFGLARAVHVAAEIARALAYAHRVEHGGLVHRDVSPQNVLLSFEGEVKLADFGIARVLGSGDVTSPGTVKGKLAYMAPEQARGGALDARADLFSLGVILWELCTGRRLFARDSDAATLAAVMAREPVAPPSSWNEAVPPELDAIVTGALARDPGGRTPSAEAMAAALASVRLRIATSADDVDLRALLSTLWPDREAADPAARGASTAVRSLTDSGGVDRTVVRGATPAVPVPIASEETSVASTPVPRHDSDAPTRTDARSAGRRITRRRVRGILAAGSIAVALGAGARLWLRRDPRTSPAVAPASTADTRADADEVRAAPTPARAAAPAEPPPAPSTARDAVPAGPTTLPVAAPAATGARAPAVATAAPARTTKTTLRPAANAHAVPVASAAPASHRGPPVAEGTATVSVRALPWAFVAIDGEDAGETPFEVTVRAGSHRLRVHHPTLGEEEIAVTLRPGERYAWHPRLSRP